MVIHRYLPIAGPSSSMVLFQHDMRLGDTFGLLKLFGATTETQCGLLVGRTIRITNGGRGNTPTAHYLEFLKGSDNRR